MFVTYPSMILILPRNSALYFLEGYSYILVAVFVSITLPLSIIAIFDEIDKASSWSCVTSINVISRLRWILTSSRCISMRKFASNADRGSSRRTIFGLFTIALANATLCRCPPDNSDGYLFM